MITVTGLWIPIVTPMYRGAYDPLSMSKMVDHVDSFVDGYVPCLSTGEGSLLSDQLWESVITDLRSKTKKPIIAGMKRVEAEDILRLAQRALAIGCQGIIVPCPSDTDEDNISFFEQLAKKSPLPVLVYNTETKNVKTVEAFQQLDRIANIVGIKDSSLNITLFQKLITLRKAGSLRLSLLQGMEHQLFASKGCDGFLTSLLNSEPELCRQLFLSYPEEMHRHIMEKLWWQHNLGGEWYLTLKAILYTRGLIQSAEQVKQTVHV